MVEDRIKAADTWTIQLLWQDAAGIVRPVDTAGENHVTLVKSTGTGGDDYFSVRVPAGATHGNFTVVVRKDDPGDQAILWSWHLWVTGYNPNQPVAIVKDKFIYPVPGGGQVERYYGTRFGYPNNDSRTWDGTTWSPDVTPAASLAQSVLMDRNIGALNANFNAQTARTNLYYQWGRKDPIPGNIALYKIDGTALTVTNGDFAEQIWGTTSPSRQSPPTLIGSSQIIYSINNPMYMLTGFYGLAEGYGWNDPRSTTPANYQIKSIYDPCPEGWRIAPDGTWADFRHGNTANFADRGLAWASGLRYYPYIMENGVDYQTAEYAFYAAVGQRNGSNNTMYNNGAAVLVYMPLRHDRTVSFGHYFNATTNLINPKSYMDRYTNTNVRCASE